MTPAVQALLARTERTWTRWTGWIARRNGALARRVRWPIAAMAPYRRRALHLARKGSLGDVLMCTPALRELHRVHPRCRVTFFTDFPQLVQGLAAIQAVLPFSERSPQALDFVYETSIPPHRHIAKILGDCIGVEVKDVRPTLALDPDLAEQWQARLDDLPRPIVGVNRSASYFTPNKDWPDLYWCELIDRLLRTCSVVELGADRVESTTPKHQNYRDFRGQTSIPDLVALVNALDVHAGPMSGPVHIAAALNKPSVVIYGGYEHPICSQYDGNVNLFTKLSCSPCWLTDHCPYDRECLRQIRPDQVHSLVLQTISR